MTQMPVDIAKTGSLEFGNILFATVDTRVATEHLQLPGPPGWNWTVNNIGFGKQFESFESKVKLMQEWVDTLQDDYYVVFMDGGDVMYGGCDLADLLERFETLSEVTSAPIIFGAEYNCYEPPMQEGCDNYPQNGREEVLNAFDVTAEDLDS